jgi:hypothetical protein
LITICLLFLFDMKKPDSFQGSIDGVGLSADTAPGACRAEPRALDRMGRGSSENGV